MLSLKVQMQVDQLVVHLQPYVSDIRFTTTLHKRKGLHLVSKKHSIVIRLMDTRLEPDNNLRKKCKKNNQQLFEYKLSEDYTSLITLVNNYLESIPKPEPKGKFKVL